MYDMNTFDSNNGSKTPIEIALQVSDDGTVTARQVYEFLELNPTVFARWCNMNIVENEFAEENIDFWVFYIDVKNPKGGRPSTNYKLTIGFAKKLCMKEHNERGEQAWNYFTKIENDILQSASKHGVVESPEYQGKSDADGLKIFENSEFGKVRTVMIDGKIHFVGVDVARALEYTNCKAAIHNHCDGYLKWIVTDSLGREQETKIIPEGDVYRLIVGAAKQSKNPKIREKAKRFESWIFDEIVPDVNKHGMYITGDKLSKILSDPKNMAEVLLKYSEEKEARIRLENENTILQNTIEQQNETIEQQKPKVDFAEKIQKSKHNILVREFAKLMQDENICDFGEHKMYEWLRAKKILNRNNEPYQKYMKYFQIKETLKKTKWGERIFLTTVITPKGQFYLYKRLLKEKFSEVSA